MRRWRNMIGPGESRRMAIAIASARGAVKTSPATAADDVEGALPEHAGDAIRARDDGIDGDAGEFLDAAVGQRVLEHEHRDPDDLALLLAQPGDLVGLGPMAQRQADRDLVDDVRVEHRLDVGERPDHRPATRMSARPRPDRGDR